MLSTVTNRELNKTADNSIFSQRKQSTISRDQYNNSEYGSPTLRTPIG